MFIFEETSESSAPSHTEQHDVIREKDVFFFLFCPFVTRISPIQVAKLFSTEVSTVTINTFVVILW